MPLKVSDILTTRFNEVVPAPERATKNDFIFVLNKLDEEGLVSRLSQLIEDITITGKKLNEHMDIKDMRRYRSLIGDFFNDIVTNSHKFSRENFLDKRGRHRVYSIIRVVNQDLDDLAQELLKKEKDHLRILELTDEIKGLLLDILC